MYLLRALLKLWSVEKKNNLHILSETESKSSGDENWNSSGLLKVEKPIQQQMRFRWNDILMESLEDHLDNQLIAENCFYK